MEKKLLDKIMPIHTVIDGYVVSRRGDVTLGWELTLPSQYSLTASQYDEMLNSFSSAVRALPDWTLVHRQDVYLKKSYESEHAQGYLGRCYERHFLGREYLDHRSFLFLTMASRNSAIHPTSSSGLYRPMTLSKLPTRQSLEAFRQCCSDFIAVVTSNGFLSASALCYKDFVGSGQNPGLIQSAMMLGSNDLMMSNVEIGRDHIKVLGKSAIGFSISETDPLPSMLSSTLRCDRLSTQVSDLSLSFGSQIGSELDCEHIVNHYIIKGNQTSLIKSLDRKKRHMTSMSKYNENRIGAEEISEYLDAVQKESLTTVRSHLNVIAWNTDGDLTDVKGKVSAALGPLGITGVQNTCDMPILWYASIPGAGTELGEDNLMLMELKSALALGIYESFDRPLDKGKFKLCDRFRHVPLTLDFQEAAMSRGYIGNINAFILGASGTGKSFSTNTILRNLYEAGESIFVIDAGDSYQGLCSVVNDESNGVDGFYYSWDKDHPLSFNPFLGFETWLDANLCLDMENSSVNFFLSFLKTCWSPKGGWTSQDTTILCQILTDFLRETATESEGAQVIFDDFYRHFLDHTIPAITKEKYRVGALIVGEDRFDAVAFGLALQPYSINGAYGFLLNERHPKDLLSSRFTVFEVDQLSQGDQKFYSLCILCIMNAFDVKMRSLQGTKVMVIEEAWKAIANETMAPYLAGLWKTSRKFRTSAVVVTQQISDILSSAVIRDTILKNSDVRILLDQSGNQNCFDQIGDLLGLSPHERSLVLSINRCPDPSYRYKELFLSLGGKRSGVYAVEVSAQEAVAYESDKLKKQPFLDLCEELGNSITAIEKLI